MIPSGSNYPEKIDTNDNLFQVHDALRMQLSEDYVPGDTSITVYENNTIMNQFDSTGIITLTEQCSDAELRAISFYYGSKTDITFDELELLPGFVDSAKPKNITNVTQNVMAQHHNAIKDAVIAIENMAGKKGEAPVRPLEGTMEQRISYLRNIVLPPKAWFSVDTTLGLAPLTVTFTDQSFRLGTDGTSIEVSRSWDFGDNTGPSIIQITENTEVPSQIVDVIVNDEDGGEIKKTYMYPGIYDVTLTVTNDFGTDSVTFPELITARFPAPDVATIEFLQRTGQIITQGTPENGPYTTTSPKIRCAINSLIDVYIDNSINVNTGNTNSGEVVDEGNNPIDPIVSYKWHFSDDLEHNNSYTTRASFSIGGNYDLILRTDTRYGAYRITNYPNAFDIVENINLWLWTYNPAKTQVNSSEFGLMSETFKIKGTSLLTLNKNDDFLTGQLNEEQQKKEFNRNNGFTSRGANYSGLGGTGLLYWASGRGSSDPASDEHVKFSEYNGFYDTYTERTNNISNNPIISRPWNWVSFASSQDIYFILGGKTTVPSLFQSPTNQTKDTFDLSNLTNSYSTLADSNYKNGADELKSNQVTYVEDNLDSDYGKPLQGHMSVYRSAWLNDAGYFLRNEGTGTFFRIKSFYKTAGTGVSLFNDIKKLPDMAGIAKIEGQLVALSQGLYFFSNSGSVAAYSTTAATWATGGPGINSSSFRLLQDTSVLGFDDNDQTLLAASDGDKTAYLSFDYSENCFIKFNEIDTTFSKISSRPSGEQWQMNIF